MLQRVVGQVKIRRRIFLPLVLVALSLEYSSREEHQQK